MDPTAILMAFVALRLLQHALERYLARLNRSYYLDAERQRKAGFVLGIAEDEMERTVAYTEDKFKFGAVATWIHLMATLTFLAAGGLGFVEQVAKALTLRIGGGPIVVGLLFFAGLGLCSAVLGLPFAYLRAFRLEEKHGFNRQTRKGFFIDRLKGLVLGVALGGLILASILWIMEKTGQRWWIYAWLAMTGFSFLTAWLYPTFLAPLFNKFSEVKEGDLRDRIYALADRIGFQAAGIFVMDASKRSSHGNAYFTGVLGKKRIVLFDTLVEAMSPREVVAVLAHELGHFKLHHVRWQLVRGTLMSGLTFYLLSLCLPLTEFYASFGLDGVSNYSALVVFGLWLGVLDFVLQPLENFLSRRNEFAADSFAREHGGGASDLGEALLKLRETSHAMPLSHPVFSAIYYSHPPMLERLAALGYTTQKGPVLAR